MTLPIPQRIEAVRQSIGAACDRSGRKESEIRLVCVSKAASAEQVREAFQAGCREFGENRIQQARRKLEEIADLDVRWHGIGPVQSNKAGQAVRMFDLIHSVYSHSNAEALARQAEKQGKTQDMLIQVNVSGESSKFGLSPDEVEATLAAISALPGLNVRGLMTMAPFLANPEETRPFFRALRQLRDTLRANFPALTELSMGMTNDFEIAIEEGATLIRVGSAIFTAD